MIGELENTSSYLFWVLCCILITLGLLMYTRVTQYSPKITQIFFYKHGIPNVSLTFPEHVKKKFDPLGLPNRLDVYFGFWLPC